GIPLGNLAAIPRGTLLLTVTGDRDNVAHDADAKRIFRESTSVLLQDKNYVVLISDQHGQPALEATHFAPVAFDPAYDNGERRGQSAIRGGAAPVGPLRQRLRERMPQRAQSNSGGGNAPADVSSAAHRGSNALDYYGLWKLFDGLSDAAFYHRNREYALGNTPEQRFMGRWSDGTPVKELSVTQHP